jgi:hypothetical protein
MAKKQAAKPPAKPANRAAAPPVTIKDIEESSLFDDAEPHEKVVSEPIPEKQDVGNEQEKPSNQDAEVEPAADNEKTEPVPAEPAVEQTTLPERPLQSDGETSATISQDEGKPPVSSQPEKIVDQKDETVAVMETVSDDAKPPEAETSLLTETPMKTPSTTEPPVALEQVDSSPVPETKEDLLQHPVPINIASGMDLDDESIFESKADLEEIFSAMADVKKGEAKAIASAVAAIESGQDAASALKDLSSDVADKIQKQLEERSLAEEVVFVTEEDFIQHARNSLSKTWYHCIYFLAFKSESGTATKKVMYDALKEILSKSPVDPVPEHMFNFGLSALVKVMLYDKPVVSFKKGEFALETNRKKLQELLLTAGRPMSRRPVVTRKEEKKMISDFFDTDKLF